MKKLLCAAAIALAPVLAANAEDYQAADNQQNLLQECRSHMQEGRLMRSAPDHLREDCHKLMAKSDAKEDAKEEAKEAKKADKKAKEEAKEADKAAKKAKKEAKEAEKAAKKAKKEHHENSGY